MRLSALVTTELNSNVSLAFMLVSRGLGIDFLSLEYLHNFRRKEFSEKEPGHEISKFVISLELCFFVSKNPEVMHWINFQNKLG